MVAHLRGKGDPPGKLEHGSCSEHFSLEIHHGGFFVGSGELRSYVGEKVDWFDYIEKDTWSLLWFEDFVQELGYQDDPGLKIYWLLPGKIVADGLRILVTDHDANVMAQVSEKCNNNLVVYFDHVGTMEDSNWDDIVYNPVNELPKVVSPHKVEYVPRKNEKLPVFYTDLKRSRVDQAGPSEELEYASPDSEDDVFHDSDNDIDDRDADLFEDLVDMDVDGLKDNKKAKGSKLKTFETKRTGVDVEYEDSEDEELELPDSEGEGEEGVRFKSWTERDLNNPVFFVGQVFPSAVELRKAIAQYSVKNRVDIKLPRNDSRRVRGHCAEGCPWTLYASMDSRKKAFVVKSFYGVHNCQREWIVKKCSAKWLAEHYFDMFRANEKMSINSLGNIVQKELNLKISRSKLARARRLILAVLHGDEVEQYGSLWDYGQELRTSNPGSSFFLNLAEGNLFSTCYMSLDACKRGFLEGCRPIICLDGCHIKTKYGGQLLTAVGMDPNDCIYPIAMAVVEVEDKKSWTWFLQTLKDDLRIDSTYPWTIMTDKQKGLIPAVQKIFPQSEHRFCVRHLYSNFQEKFKGEILKNQLWTCARSSSVESFNRNMEYMKSLNEDAHKWLEKMAPNTWVRAYFSEFPKCDILLNNNCEVFNKYILEARELPVLSMFERIKSQLMSRLYNKQQELVNDMTSEFCPKIRQKVIKNSDFANMCYALPSGQGVFQVNVKDYQHIVDIHAKTCDCRRWQLTGVPCSHAIACLRHERIKPESVLAPCYSIESFKKAYGYNIWPCRNKTNWEKVEGPEVLPPVYEKKVGRPPKSRKKQPQEIQGKHGPTLSRHGVTIHCSHCSEADHNRKGCKLREMALSSEQARAHVKKTHAQLARQAEVAAIAAAANQSEPTTEEPPTDEPINLTIITDHGPSTQASTTLLSDLLSQETIATTHSQPLGPLPDSGFIMNNQPMPRPTPLTTCTKTGRAAASKKRKAGPGINKSAPASKKKS